MKFLQDYKIALFLFLQNHQTIHLLSLQKEKELALSFQSEKLDISLPGRAIGVGHIHPITQVVEEIKSFNISNYRVDFNDESYEDVNDVLNQIANSKKNENKKYTQGHYRRGVE